MAQEKEDPEGDIQLSGLGDCLLTTHNLRRATSTPPPRGMLLMTPSLL